MNSLSSWNLSVLALLFISAIIGCSVTQGNNTMVSNAARFPRMMERVHSKLSQSDNLFRFIYVVFLCGLKYYVAQVPIYHRGTAEHIRFSHRAAKIWNAPDGTGEKR